MQACVANTLDNAFRVAAIASKNGAFACQKTEPLLKKCGPFDGLTQNEVAVIQTVFLNHTIAPNDVQHLMDNVISKFTDAHSMEEILQASVSSRYYLKRIL